MKKPLTLLMFVIFLTCVFYCQEIEVTNPNGYERWELGSIKYITWRSSGVSGNFKISLWKDGKKVENIAPDLSNENRSYRWQVGKYNGGIANPGTGYTIKIKEKGKPVSDVSDAPFTIFEVCRLRLNSLSKSCGLTGDVFKMHGSWGSTQGTKIPCINKGRRNLLTVLSWSNTVIRVKIPAGLAPGVYAVGAYCSNEPNSPGSNWKKFKIVSSADQCAPDFEVDYIEITSRSKVGVRIKNNGEEYTGPVKFRVVGLDKLTGGSFTLDKTVTLYNFSMKESPSAKILHLLDFVWPDNVCLIAFAVTIDPKNHILELNERNNHKSTTWYRDQSSSPIHSTCFTRITGGEIKIAKAPYGRWIPVKKSGRIILASDRANIILPLSNCCPKAKILNVTFIFDHRNEGGEHKILHQASIKIEAGEQKSFYFSNIKFPRKKDFKRFHVCINACNFYVNLKVD